MSYSSIPRSCSIISKRIVSIGTICASQLIVLHGLNSHRSVISTITIIHHHSIPYNRIGCYISSSYSYTYIIYKCITSAHFQLCLRRTRSYTKRSIFHGHPIPLSGYIVDIPDEDLIIDIRSFSSIIS